MERCSVFQQFGAAQDSHGIETSSRRSSENERGKKQKEIGALGRGLLWFFVLVFLFLECVFVAQLHK